MRREPHNRPGDVDSPYLAMDEAAAYLKYRSLHAASVVRAQLRRAGVPMYRRNQKSWLVRRVDIDEWVITGKCIEGQRYFMDRHKRSASLRPVPYTPPPDMGKNTAGYPAGRKRGPGRPRKDGSPARPSKTPKTPEELEQVEAGLS